jgi:hypothetical protein
MLTPDIQTDQEIERDEKIQRLSMFGEHVHNRRRPQYIGVMIDSTQNEKHVVKETMVNLCWPGYIN